MSLYENLPRLVATRNEIVALLLESRGRSRQHRAYLVHKIERIKREIQRAQRDHSQRN